MFGDSEQDRRNRQDELDLNAQRRRIEQMGTSGGGGCMEGLLLLWIGPAALIYWLNYALPFWLRVIIAVAAGGMTTTFVDRKWEVILPAKIAVFVVVAGGLFAVFRDPDGTGMTLFHFWSAALGIVVGLAIVAAILGLILSAANGYLSALRENPFGLGCGTLVTVLVAGWLIWVLCLKAPDPNPVATPAHTASHKHRSEAHTRIHASP